MKKTQKSKEIGKAQAVKRTLVLVAAYLMEEEGWDAEKLAELYAGIERWTIAINDHLINIRTVVDLINEKTNANIRW